MLVTFNANELNHIVPIEHQSIGNIDTDCIKLLRNNPYTGGYIVQMQDGEILSILDNDIFLSNTLITDSYKKGDYAD